MPTVCTSIKVSRDGQFILAAGTYKPRIRCYDAYQLSLKFERCLDSDVVAFDMLSNDYSKLVFLHCNLYVEFHSQHGHYYRRVFPSLRYSDSILSEAGSSTPFTQMLWSTMCVTSTLSKCASGTAEGKVECWDPRVRSRVGMLDCALSSVTEGTKVEGLPSVSALKFNGSLTMAVGTSTGQVLLYDLRASHPLLVKDHYYGLPIKSVNFQDHLDLVLTADSKIIKIWNKDKGKVFSSIEPQTNINDVCIYPDSGMLFTANEDPKMNTLSVPALGPAPRWCSFLDNLTEELKESPESTIYDDYKFVTRKDLENLGEREVCLTSWDLLRAYMHRFFMDIRLYHKVKTIANPFAYDEYRKDKISQKIGVQDAEYKSRPKVNKELALKLMEEGENEEELSARKKGKVGANTPAHTLGEHVVCGLHNLGYTCEEVLVYFVQFRTYLIPYYPLRNSLQLCLSGAHWCGKLSAQNILYKVLMTIRAGWTRSGSSGASYMRSNGTATQPCWTRTPPRTRLRAGNRVRSPDSSRLRLVRSSAASGTWPASRSCRKHLWRNIMEH
ncbi:unnamed protein product [Oncorhynchus mykiss]|uniref:Nucleolar protein 10 n=1 Tax=Oncorhynchus mykiss TaxID=8022 RepID=A0A060W3G6_ONCMY|nr:unnamed protein product [Oncorhynchus mykiss]